MWKIHRYLWNSIFDPDYCEIYGSASWMSLWEQLRFFSPWNEGFRVGRGKRLSVSESSKGICIVAPPGAWKSSSFIIPNLLTLGKASAIVTDPSGEIWRYTSGYLAKTHSIQVLNLTDVNHSFRYNPLAYASTHEEFHVLAGIFIEHVSTSEDDQFWGVGASQILWLILVALKNKHDAGFPEFLTLIHVRQLLERVRRKHEREESEIDAFMRQYLSSELFESYRSFVEKEEKIIMGFIATALASLELWKDSRTDIAHITNSNSLILTSIRRTPTLVYLVVPEHEVRRFSLFFKLFYFQCFKSFSQDSGGLPVSFFMDEFGNLGRVPFISVYVNTVRKHRISIVIVLQSLRQLDANYGRDTASTIFEGLSTKIFLPGIQEMHTLEYLERLLGTRTILDISAGYSNRRAMAEPLLRIPEIRTLEKRHAILVSGNRNPVRLTTQSYFDSYFLRRRSQIPPVF